MKANQKGFSVVEILIVIVVVGLLGAVGWLVYDRQKSKTDNKDTIAQTNQQEQKQEAPKEEAKPQEKTVKYSTYDKGGIRFEYPEDWKIDGTTSFASIQSPDFTREGLQVMKINSGAFIEASQTDIPQKDRTADNFQTWGDQYVGDTKNAKVSTINGKKVVQFDAQHRNGDYTWDATTTIFFRSNGTRVEVRFGYKVGDKQAHNATYQHVLETMKIE
jgi:prepilin-type N-terminal cleavage/methylation domain-containing protein